MTFKNETFKHDFVTAIFMQEGCSESSRKEIIFQNCHFGIFKDIINTILSITLLSSDKSAYTVESLFVMIFMNSSKNTAPNYRLKQTLLHHYQSSV